MKIDAQIIPEKGNFKYLGSINPRRHGDYDDAIYWSGVGEMEARFCYKNAPPRFNDKFYKVVV